MSGQGQNENHQGLSRMVSLRSLRDKENNVVLAKNAATSENSAVAASKHTLTESKTSLTVRESITNDRMALRSKSSNGLKVQNNSKTVLFNSKNQEQQQPSLFTGSNSGLFSNANKARKVIKKPLSIFSGGTDRSIQSQPVTFHDSITLQRSQSQLDNLKKGNQSDSANSENTVKSLSRSTSAFSSTFSSSFDDTFFSRPKLGSRKVKSQLKLGADNDMAAFFKKSKEEEQKQLGLPDEELERDTFKDTSGRLEEITFTEDTDDITSMKRLATERNSPVYQRTHKVSLHNLLSSSTESDIEETTFDYKDKETTKFHGYDLESLIMSSNRAPTEHKRQEEDIEVEFVSSNTNGRYDDSLPDVVADGLQQPMSKDLLSNLWGEPTAKAREAAEAFKDPLGLELNLEDELPKPEMLQISKDDLLAPEDIDIGLDLVFSDSDDNEENEEGKGEGTTSLSTIVEFYESKANQSSMC